MPIRRSLVGLARCSGSTGWPDGRGLSATSGPAPVVRRRGSKRTAGGGGGGASLDAIAPPDRSAGRFLRGSTGHDGQRIWTGLFQGVPERRNPVPTAFSTRRCDPAPGGRHTGPRLPMLNTFETGNEAGSGTSSRTCWRCTCLDGAAEYSMTPGPLLDPGDQRGSGGGHDPLVATIAIASSRPPEPGPARSGRWRLIDTTTRWRHSRSRNVHAWSSVWSPGREIETVRSGRPTRRRRCGRRRTGRSHRPAGLARTGTVA